jgi:GH15 family glucan-1,4-alpha-glucosidase
MRNLGIIGNCAFSALVDHGSVEWLCWPRPDDSFVFGRLLDREQGGSFTIEPEVPGTIVQEYVENTNVLRTVFEGPTGVFELLDFAPRFDLYGRYFKPTMLVRILRPISGEPRVQVRCRPVYDYGRMRAQPFLASNHIQFLGLPAPLRLTTNLPLSYVEQERPFTLTEERHLVLTWGEPLEAPLEETADSFLTRTVQYWRRWIKQTRIPRDYQRQVIRSALVLKLHQYEDTGALLAATTTSLPESPRSGRTWDYRFCWLRDAYFTLNAFERTGHVEEMERFLVYLRNVVEDSDGVLRPVYSITGGAAQEERVLAHLSGFQGDGPVRIGNQARDHVQNDVYGEMILAISRMLLDVRFAGDESVGASLRLVHRLLDQIERRMEEPDAGPWELRGIRQLHSYTLLAHWAGSRRAAEIGEALGSPELQQRGLRLAANARDLLWQRCWDPQAGALTQAADQRQLDAVMLIAVHAGFFAPDDPRAATHVAAIQQRLQTGGGLLRRYVVADDFGYQEAAFTVCSFWLVEARAAVGPVDEARALFERLLQLQNGLGLYSEDILPQSMEQSGNFPQTYSHVGLINSAFRIARSWM